MLRTDVAAIGASRALIYSNTPPEHEGVPPVRTQTTGAGLWRRSLCIRMGPSGATVRAGRREEVIAAETGPGT